MKITQFIKVSKHAEKKYSCDNVHFASVVFVMSLIVFNSGAHKCRRRFTTQVIRYENCLPRRIVTHSCEGSCITQAYLSETNPLKIIHTCSQCKETVTMERRMIILCPNKDGLMPFKRKVITVQIPRKCECEQCSFNKVINVFRAKAVK